MSSSQLTFGVEIEMALAIIIDPAGQDPDPQDPRIARFNAIPDDHSGSADRPQRPTQTTVRRHVTNTLLQAGYPIAANLEIKNDIGVWELVSDASIRGPKGADTLIGFPFTPQNRGSYIYCQLELRSPAYYFTPEALDNIRNVCTLLTSKYRININESTGLHVHVGDGMHGFKFKTLQKLILFLWSFEPQLNSLHPPHRIGHYYCRSIRQESLFSCDFRRENNQQPTALEGLNYFSRCKDIIQLLTRVQCGDREDSYDFKRLLDRSKGMVLTPSKPTIEFRQHQGCLDG